MSGESDIMLGNITFTYLNAEAPAIRDISLEVEAGSVTAILGPVGAGKSTLLRILNRLIPTVIPGRLQGEVVVAGKTARGSDVAQMSRYVNLVFDDPSLQIVGLTVEEDVAFGPANLGLPRDEIWQRVREALGKTRLVGFEKRNPRTLSGGEQQLLAMAGVLAMRPRVIALDEPSAMLDPLGKTQVLEAVRELNRRYGTTVVVADSGSDVEAVLEFADRAVLMHRGQVVADGTPQEVFSGRDVVEKTQMKPPQVTRLAWEVGWRL
ncbi:MAG: ATP-binding cassette domain-containing protein, partial [Bacillota bacterium]